LFINIFLMFSTNLNITNLISPIFMCIDKNNDTYLIHLYLIYILMIFEKSFNISECCH
jgi:hypothetical protein